METKKRNNSIDLFRYICAVLVVVIHTEPFYDGDCSWLGVFLKQFLARIAVPFFFAVSGYFLFLKIDQKPKAAFLSAWRLAKVYLFWSIPYVLINLWIRRDEMNIPSLIGKTIFEVVVSGSYYHFWFFPALIYATLMIATLYRFFGWKSVATVACVLYTVGLLGSSYLPIGETIPVLSDVYAWEHFSILYRIFTTAIPFVVAGGWVARRKNAVVSYRHHQSYDWWILAAFVIGFVLEKCVLLWIGFPITDPNTLMLYPLTAVVLIVLLRRPLEHCAVLGAHARTCANWIYYMHAACILFLEKGWQAVFHQPLGSVWMFVLTVAALTVSGVLMHRINRVRKLLN